MSQPLERDATGSMVLSLPPEGYFLQIVTPAQHTLLQVPRVKSFLSPLQFLCPEVTISPCPPPGELNQWLS